MAFGWDTLFKPFLSVLENEKQSENKNKKYLQKICSICDTLSHLLMRYNEDIVAEQWGEELPTPRDGDIGGASGDDTLTEDEEPGKEKEPLTEKEPQREKTSGPPDDTQYTEGEKNVKAAKEEYPYLEGLPHGDTYLENDFSTRNCIRCLYADKELNETEYYDPYRKIKPFKKFQLGDTNLALQDRKKLRKKINRICRSKSYLLTERRSNTSSTDVSLSKGGMNHLSDLERILLGINKTVTTFGTDKNDNINATVEFFTPYGGKEKNVIHINEYDYFFCSSSNDESEVQSSTDGQTQHGRNQKGKNPLFNRINVFYVGNKKVILDRKKKEKIIFQMDPNGILRKDIFKKGKKNENVLKKSFKENEWSDDHVDFCYLNEQKKKEKIVITKRRDGIYKRLFRDHELNGKQEIFDFYRRSIFGIREVHLYDDAEAMAFCIIRRSQTGDKKKREKENLRKEKEKFKGAQRDRVASNKRTHVHTNEWSLEMGKGCPGSSKENSLESIFSKLKKRKERYLKAIYLCTDKETGPIRKSQNLRRIKMRLNGGEGMRQPMGERHTGKVPLAEREKAMHPVPPQMDPPLWETQIGKVKKPKRLPRGGVDAPLRKCTSSAEKKGKMDRGEKAKGGEKLKLSEKTKRGEKSKLSEKTKRDKKSKLSEKTKRGEKSQTDKPPLRGRFTAKKEGHPIRDVGERTEQGKHPQDDSPKEGNNGKLGDDIAKLGDDIVKLSDDMAKLSDDIAKLGDDSMIYNKNENGYMSLYKEVKEGNGGVAVGTYSMAKLASIIEKSHAEGDNPEIHGHQKTNKKIEEFVFNENLKDISITSHNMSRKSSKNCVKYHQPQGEGGQGESGHEKSGHEKSGQEERGHNLNELNERREASAGGSYRPANVQPNGYSNYSERDVIKAISTVFSKENAKLNGETVPRNSVTYRLPTNPDDTSDNNFLKKSSNSLAEMSESPFGDISKNTLGNLRDHVRRQLSDSQSDEMSHQLSRQLSSQMSHQLSSQMSHQLSSQMSHQLRSQTSHQLSSQTSHQLSSQTSHQMSSQMSHQLRIETKERPLKNRRSEVSSGLKSDPEESKEEQNIANAAAVAVRTEGDLSKGGLQEVNGPLEEEKKKRQQYLSKGFRAYVHIVLSESNVVTRKCTVFFDYTSKKVSIVRNRKVFNIDVDKLYVQEIPTYEVGLGVIELVLSKRRSRVLLLESRDLVGLQNLGDEIGWISTPNDHLGLHPWGTSLDMRRVRMENHVMRVCAAARFDSSSM